jgi:Uma2 family endonuclease
MTLAPPLTAENAFPAPASSIARFTVDQYHRMIRSGVLAEDQAVELLDGWLITKMPKNPQHRIATHLVRETLEELIPPGWYVDSQEPVTLPSSEPEPDVVVVRGNTRDYVERHPWPKDVGFVVEVAESSLDQDQTLKLRLYAEAGIPIYWIVNLVDQGIEVYSDPDGPTYRQRKWYSAEENVPVVLEGKRVGDFFAGIAFAT